MADILGLVGSARRWGNSDLLARQVLLGAQAEGAQTRLVRLTDLHLTPCTGCMRCVLAGKPCPEDDDMSWLVEAIQAADGLVLAAPTYFLAPAAVIKLVMDRLLMLMGRVEDCLPPVRPAVTIATAGLEEWRGVSLPFLNAFVAACGYRPVESLLAFAPGPGEVLLDEGLMARVRAAGHRLGRGELDPSPAPPNICPTCRCEAFILAGNRAICPICGREATIGPGENGVALQFDPVADREQRWSPEGLRRHMVEWIMATGPRFLAERSQIRSRRQPYRDMEVDWLCPPSPRQE